jgi:hypothetical protein
MRDFVDTLPLRLAAVVAACVGMICLWKGIDLWVSAWRIGVTFMALLLAGLVVRRLILSLGSEATNHPGDPYRQAPGAKDAPAAPTSGKNVDVIAPGTPIGDLLRDDKAEDK